MVTRVPVPVMVLLALVAALLVGPSAAAQPGPTTRSSVSDAISVSARDEGLGNGDVALRLVDATFGPGAAIDTVLIARDDAFPDALASGALQTSAPLFLVPTDGPVPAGVIQRITMLGATRALILGGEAAVGPTVAQELRDAGVEVQRRAGGSRIETAAAIAGDLPDATIAIVARAFASGTDQTQGFADALAAGGLAADRSWPVLLTETAQLSDATRAHIRSSALEEVVIVGGAAAVSPQVEAELRTLVPTVTRLSGPERNATAVAIAGRHTGADSGRVILAEGTQPNAWAGGFAAAAHSAAFDAPIVLATDDALPDATRALLEARAGSTDVLVCLVGRAACEQGRVSLGFPPRATLTVDPAGGALAAGQPITVTVTGSATDVLASGTCLTAPQPLADSGGQVTRSGEGACTLVVELVLPEGRTQRDEVDYVAPMPVPTTPLLLAPGGCAGYANAQLSADGSTAALVATPEDGCDHIAGGRAVVFVDVETGARVVVGFPAGFRHTNVRVSPLALSADGQRAVITLIDDAFEGGAAIFERATGRVAFLHELNATMTPDHDVTASGVQAFTPDGRLLGRFCGTTGCFVALDPATGEQSIPGNVCTQYFAAVFEAVICEIGFAPAGPTAVFFPGVHQDGSRHEVRLDVVSGAVQEIASGCDPGLTDWSAAGQRVYRTCRLPFSGDWWPGGLVVSDFATGQRALVFEHRAPGADQPLRSGVVDPTGRFVPLQLLDGEGAAGTGRIFDVGAGQHVDLGRVVGVPQLSTTRSWVVVALPEGLTRLPVTLPA